MLNVNIRIQNLLHGKESDNWIKRHLVDCTIYNLVISYCSFNTKPSPLVLSIHSLDVSTDKNNCFFLYSFI